MRLIHHLLLSPNEMETRETSAFQEWHDLNTNQLVMLVKPEITALGADAKPALDMIEAHLTRWGCAVRAARLVGPSYLARHRLIDEHYGVIGLYSRAASKLGIVAPPELSSTSVVGAHELMAMRPDLDATRLLSMHSAAATFRLAPGAYAFHYKEDGIDALVVNGFHPAQLAHFYKASAPILVLELASPTPWRRLRTEMVGATDPRNSPPDTMRRILLDQADELGVQQVGSMRNGVHLSAGPLEGAQELRRFLSALPRRIGYEATNTGSLLAALVGSEKTEAILSNQQDLGWDPYTETELMDTWRLDDFIHKRMGTDE